MYMIYLSVNLLCDQKYYFVGRDKMKQYWQVLKIDCIEVVEFNVVEDFLIYMEVECKMFFLCIVEGNKLIGGF